MAKQTVAGQFVDILVRTGVQRPYGVGGDNLNPVVDAVRRTDRTYGKVRAYAVEHGMEPEQYKAGLRGLLRPRDPA
ncbi:hypothetical protein, partial [Streptomyces rimosus]|uniref:hypothetical protein n=1 Tax=Streptomyces rimosus TaxID=1927 RepID=UPI0006C069C6